MTYSKYMFKLGMDYVKVLGLCILPIILYHAFYQLQAIPVRYLYQIALLAAALTFRMESMVNFHDLNERMMRNNYWISSFIADISLIALLATFSNPELRYINGWVLVFLYFGLRFMFYLLIHYRNMKDAKLINDKLKRMHSSEL